MRRRCILFFGALWLLSCDDTSAQKQDGGTQDVIMDTFQDGDAQDSHDGGEEDLQDTIEDGASDGDQDGTQDGDMDAGDGGSTGDPTPLTDAAVLIASSYEHVVAALDRTTLTGAFASAGYTPPPGAYLLIGKVSPGVGSPWVHWYSYQDTAVTFSYGNYWPASTIKLTAAVCALRTLADYGLTSQATIDFTEDDGHYSGTVHALITEALEVSSNVAYNRLMIIGGFEEMNEGLLTTAQGYPQMILQRRYTHPFPGSNLRTSPAISYQEGALVGTIPQRYGAQTYASCPDEANCITLVELLDILRRVTLHTELPQQERFSYTALDQQRLMTALHNSPSTLGPGAQAALGSASVYNKTGVVPGYDRLDHGLVVDNHTGERYLVALSVPYNSNSEGEIALLAQQAIEAVMLHTPSHPPVQITQGSPVTVQLDDHGPVAGGRRVEITLELPGADGVLLWVDRYPLGPFLPTQVPNRFSYTHTFSLSGIRQIVVIPTFNGTPSGYRRLTVAIP